MIAQSVVKIVSSFLELTLDTPSSNAGTSSRFMSKRPTSSAEEQAVPLSFEDSLKALEEKVRRLEQGNLPLESSLQHYGEAIKLISACQIQLDQAQRRVELLSGIDAQGNPITQPLDASSGDSLEEKQAARSRRRSSKRESAADDHSGEPPQESLLF